MFFRRNDPDKELLQTILEATRLIAENAQLEDDALFDLLVAQGLDQKLAYECLVFIPTVLGRVALANKGPRFSDDYLWMHTRSGTRTAGRLMDLDVYRVAFKEFSRQYPPFDFRPVILRSSEVAAIDNALKNGAKLENLHSGPLMMYSDD